MSIIEASTVRVTTMADGTLRLTLDIEPTNAKDAFGLFGSPGTPVALAALKAVAQQQAEPEKPVGGPRAKWAGQMCQDKDFIKWMQKEFPGYWRSANLSTPDGEIAAHAIRTLCGITSRAELDHDHRARQVFDDLIREPWSDYFDREFS